MFEKGDPSKLSAANFARLEKIIARLDGAFAPEDMSLPGWRFHALKGAMSGRFAVNVSGNWRVTFGWEGNDA